MRFPKSGLYVAICLLGLGMAIPVLAQSTAAVEPPRDIQFRDPFVGRQGDVLNTNVVPPDSIVFRQPFIGRDTTPFNTVVSPPRGVVFREPFVGRGSDAIRTDVQPPQGIVFREPFLTRDGSVLDENVAAPDGIVFRDVFLDRDGIVTAAPSTPSARLIDQASVLPNPFNPSTRISFRLGRAAEASVAVYDARGRLVRVLHRGHLEADAHVLDWDGTDDTGAPVASGVYMVRVAAGDETVVVKGVLVE